MESKELYLKRLREKLPPKESDPDLTLLKGHLLVEEVLRDIVAKKLPSPSALDDADLRFYEILCLARALHKSHPSVDWIWDACRKLNKIRNRLAHHLEPRGFKDMLNDFIEFIDEKFGPPKEGWVEDLGRLQHAIIMLYGGLTGFLHRESKNG